MGEASSRGAAFIRGDWLAVVQAAAAEAAACASCPGSDRMVMSVDRVGCANSVGALISVVS